MVDEIEGIMEKGLMDRGEHRYPISRDHGLPNFKCKRIACVVNVGGKCISPARCEIDEEGKCSGYMPKEKSIKRI